MAGFEKDLVLLVADSNIKAAVDCLLSKRTDSLQIRHIHYDIFVHPERDPGCLLRGHAFLQSMVKRYSHALVMFDRCGSGQEARPASELEDQVRAGLHASGWGDRADVIVLDPELEIWVWSDSPEVDRCLRWQGRKPDLRSWLKKQGLWSVGNKPDDPKKAVEEALRHVRSPRSSAIYRELAAKVSLRRCNDPAFLAFKKHLQRWFPKRT